MEEVRPSKIRLILYVIAANLVMLLTLIAGLIGHGLYWLCFDSFGRAQQRAQRKLKPSENPVNSDEYYAVIIGSGFSGLGMAIRLSEMGMNNYTIIERNHRLGGTWYANQYPGCACDVPSNLYSFSFEPNPRWSYFFSRQPEIAEYLEHCADKYNVRRHIQFNQTVIRLEWLEDRQVWQVTTESNGIQNKIYSRFIMAGYGPLSNASYPTDIPGMDRFKGQMCHTAEWNKTIDFKNKRVAIVGTGASAIQAAPELHKEGLKQMLIFQRTAPWVIPRADRAVTDFEKRLFARFPILQKMIRAAVYWVRESTVLSFAYRLPVRYLNQELVRFNLRRQVKDPELRKILTPSFELGCKRVLISNDWYPTLQQPNVQLVTDRIRELNENGIVTQDGKEHPVDIIIWSTGFQVQQFTLPIYGKNKQTMKDQWSKTMQAYRGVTVPNFPNFFILLGPNTGLGHNSVIVMIEAQIQYISEALLLAQEKKVRSIEVKQGVYENFNNKIQNGLKNTVWQSGGCYSWYKDAKGNNTTIWPDFTWVYILLMNQFDDKSYILNA